MKADLDRLMAEREIDVVMTLGGENEDPIRNYLANGVKYSGLAIKKRGEPVVLISPDMEREEAARSGLTVCSVNDLGYGALLQQYKGDTAGLRLAWYTLLFDHFGIQGRVNVYGVGDINAAFRTLLALSSHFEGRITFGTEESRASVFDTAYETKDAAELARLRDVGRRTSDVVCATRDWLANHRAKDGVVFKADGSPLTIGDVKRQVRLMLFEQDLEDTEGMIFAQGHDAGVPHSSGDNQAPLRLGESIIFDLFPREPRGYFHDMTRTWCLGRAPDEVQAAYDAVMETFHRSVAMCKIGMATNTVQQMVCEYFEAAGHPSVLNSPNTSEGYVHSLAHGLGLSVHEAPYFPTFSEKYHLQPGNVFTIEPGLYYPDRGYGVRVEDTVTLNELNQVESLTLVPYDLVIELKG